MANYYVPYSGDKPAAILINGHRLIMLWRERDELAGKLSEIGADSLKQLRTGASAAEQERKFQELARSAAAGVVVVPSEVGYDTVISNLEHQLPWLQ